MNAYAREKVFYFGLLILILLRQDFWGWERIKPILFGWMPYIMWYDLLMTIVVFGFWVWMCGWVWPDPVWNDVNYNMNVKEEGDGG